MFIESEAVEIWRDRRLPESAVPVGYAALIDALDLQVPTPLTLSCVGTRHRVEQTEGWHVWTPRHAPESTLAGHLMFALKNEGLDLAVLKRLFLAVGPEPIRAGVLETPSGAYSRRTWFLYEWLTGRDLDLEPAVSGRYVDVVDARHQFAIEGKTSPRHRVRDNLPGTPRFCPMVRRTEHLEASIGLDLATRAREVVGAVPRDLMARAAAFLLLKDSRSSYAIEGETPPQSRIQRWGRAIGDAGGRPLDLPELLRLQALVIGESRFVRLGLRIEHGFVGEHDRVTRAPIPVHIDARPEDVPELVQGVLDFHATACGELDPVIAAAMLAFGFVYIHPFQDGNGRLHRFLMHDVLARRNFHPPGMVFPISAVILDEIARYGSVLESYSRRLLSFVEWNVDSRHNVEVTNDTADFYRFFDATPHAEFLYDCVRRAVEEDIPAEVDHLRRYDAFSTSVKDIVEMPDRTIDLLFRFLNQNEGALSQRARANEFALLTEVEVIALEAAYHRAFET